MSDGSHSLLDIANRAQMPFKEVRLAADALIDCALLAEG
jgi:aminopeptidase-like protein